MPISRKITRKCIFFLVASVAITLLLLPAKIFEYHSYLRQIVSNDLPGAEYNWSLGQVHVPTENTNEDMERDDVPDIDKSEEIIKEKEEIAGKSNGIKKVLILAYMRSGSSLTGKLLEQSENSIYFFEPLRSLEWSYSRKIALVDFNNITRVAGSKVEDDKTRIKIVEDLLSCRFRSTYKNIFFDRSRSSDDRFRSFYKCVGKYLYKVDECLPPIQDLCDRSLVRIAKVIRMNAGHVSEMLENLPDLKVIHLLRDPRAILNSLLRMKLNINIKSKAKALCDEMKLNVVHFEKLFKLFPKQTTTMFYENLAKNPIATTKKLYNYIGVTTTRNVTAWVKSNMLGKQLDNGTYSIKYRNSQSVSNQWRTQRKFEEIAIIDSVCKEFYDISGYFKVMKRANLKDPKISHFQKDFELLSNLEHWTDSISINEEDN